MSPPGEETVAGAHRRPKWVPYYSAQVLLRLCSGTAHPRLRYAQALLRYTHPQRKLKQQMLTSTD
jgi:hypothetical protein